MMKTPETPKGPKVKRHSREASDLTSGASDNTPPLTPRTAKRVTAAKPAKKTSTPELIDTIGDPAEPTTFLQCEQHESKLALYLGFTDITNLRRYVLSGFFLTALNSYNEFGAYLNHKGSFELIRDRRDRFDLAQDAKNTWPIIKSKGKQRQSGAEKAAKQHRLAHLLLSLVAAVRADIDRTPDQVRSEQSTQDAIFAKYFAANDKLVLPPALDLATLIKPELGPREGESSLEPVNRVYNLLKYIRFCTANPKNVFNVRFAASSLNTAYHATASHLPDFMKPRRTELPLPPVSELVKVSDALPQLDVIVQWERTKVFPGFDELKAHLDEKEAVGIVIPSTQQKMTSDPRLMSREAWKDAIRRAFKCYELETNIYSLTVSYTLDDVAHITNILEHDWISLQTTLARLTSSTLTATVVFEIIDDIHELWESDDLPYHLRDMFAIEDGDVVLKRTTTEQVTSSTDGSAADRVDDSDGSLLTAHLEATLYAERRGHQRVKPSPKFSAVGQKEAQMAWYGGYDVQQAEGLRAFHEALISRVVGSDLSRLIRTEKPPSSLNKLNPEQRIVLEETQLRSDGAAGSRDDAADEFDTKTQASEKPSSMDDQRYYVMQSAFAGTQIQVGPHFDTCVDLLDLQQDPSNKAQYHSPLLKQYTSRIPYHYQWVGGVGLFLIMHGEIDIAKLPHPIVITDKMLDAARKLARLPISGAVLADDTGLGKTVILLLAILLHILLHADVDDAGNIIYRPVKVVVPPALIPQWIEEVSKHWPVFKMVISYSDHGYGDQFALQELDAIHEKEYPSDANLPSAIKHIWDKADPTAKFILIITSYDTDAARILTKESVYHEGIPHNPRQINKATGQEIYKKDPKTIEYWACGHAGAYSLICADEAQKVKNWETRVWTAVSMAKAPNVILATATPASNTLRDLIGLLLLLWPSLKQVVDDVKKGNDTVDWLDSIQQTDTPLLDAIGRLDPMDKRRLMALDPAHLRRLLNNHRDIHLRLAKQFNIIADLCFIRRSSASSLTTSDGTNIPLRSLFKKQVWRTAMIPRKSAEEAEYQYSHRVYAREFVEMVKAMHGSEGSKQLPGSTARAPVKHEKEAVVFPTGPLRDLAICNFSLVLARLNNRAQQAGGNTLVSAMNEWRNVGKEASFVVEITRSPGEATPRNAFDEMEFLTYGSPVLRLMFHLCLKYGITDAVNEAKRKSHQKLLIGEATPVNAWFLADIVLKTALIDAAVLHAGLSNPQKAELCAEFNDPSSSLKVLVLPLDVNGAGLNLHHACDKVFLSSIPRTPGQLRQTGGRTSRITSKYPTIIVSKETPQSHDQYRSAKNAQRASALLATNALDPGVRSLIVDILNEFQPRVDQAHRSEAGVDLLKRKSAREAQTETAKEKDKVVYKAAKEDKAKAKALERTARLSKADKAIVHQDKGQAKDDAETFAPDRPKRKTRVPDRFSDLQFNEAGKKLSAEATENVLRAQYTCDICNKQFDDHEYLVCNHCESPYHLHCMGVAAAPLGMWLCSKQCKRAVESQGGHESILGDDADIVGEPDDDFLNADDEDDDEDFIDPNVRRPRWGPVDDDEFEVYWLSRRELADFLDEKQPTDEERELILLLTIPYNHKWQESDLDNEKNLALGLKLLHNVMNGKEGLVMSSSIHIAYTHLPPKVAANIERQMNLSDKKVKKVQKQLDMAPPSKRAADKKSPPPGPSHAKRPKVTEKTTVLKEGEKKKRVI